MRLGIDFGTTNSGVGLYDGEQVHILPIDQKSQDAGVTRTLLYLTASSTWARRPLPLIMSKTLAGRAAWSKGLSAR